MARLGFGRQRLALQLWQHARPEIEITAGTVKRRFLPAPEIQPNYIAVLFRQLGQRKAL